MVVKVFLSFPAEEHLVFIGKQWSEKIRTKREACKCLAGPAASGQYINTNTVIGGLRLPDLCTSTLKKHLPPASSRPSSQLCLSGVNFHIFHAILGRVEGTRVEHYCGYSLPGAP